MKNVQPSRLNLRFASGKWRQIPQADCTVRKALEARQVVFVEDMFDHGVRGAIEPCGVVVIRNFYGDYSPGANIGAAPYTRHCFELIANIEVAVQHVIPCDLVARSQARRTVRSLTLNSRAISGTARCSSSLIRRTSSF